MVDYIKKFEERDMLCFGSINFLFLAKEEEIGKGGVDQIRVVPR